MAKICRECGEKVKGGAKFCNSCGSSSLVEIIEDKAPEKSYTAVIILGFIAAIFLPVVGIIIGIYLLTRRDSSESRDGRYIILVSVVIGILIILSRLFY